MVTGRGGKGGWWADSPTPLCHLWVRAKDTGCSRGWIANACPGKAIRQEQREGGPVEEP